MRTDRRYPRIAMLLLLLPLVAAAAHAEQTDLQAALAGIEQAVEQRRQELGIPGLALAIVRGDEVIYNRGLGRRDVAGNLPVTPNTRFAIGSCSKAFTAMAAVIAADEGKLSLDDHPRKYLPYFKLQDPEADEQVTLRDMLSHQTGLAGTDMAWYTGVLDRQEVIKVAGLAEPGAKFREKFQYQNVMYSAAGEAAARAGGTTWEKMIARRFFKPLGMKSSDTSVAKMQKAADHATGYGLVDTVATPVPMRDLTNIAPAGAINSTSTDMTQWLRLLLGRGVFAGRRLVSEQGFDELIRPHSPGGNYGLGWGLVEWKGRRVATHSGGIDGFNSLVAFMPEQQLGFVLLTNVGGSNIGVTVLDAVWTNLALSPEERSPATGEATAEAGTPAAEVPAEQEVGTYDFVEAGMQIEVVIKDGQLTAIVPNQPEYPLERVAGRRYKLGGPAPPGFFMTFRAIEGEPPRTEVYLEQPHGNFALPTITAADQATAAAAAAGFDGPHAELIGKYVKDAFEIEMTVKQGRVALVVPGQPPYPVIEQEGEPDLFRYEGLPDTFGTRVKRDGDGKVVAIELIQPQGNAEFTRVEPSEGDGPAISVDELMTKVVEAFGGEANLRKHTSLRAVADIEFETQGVTGEVTVYARAPGAGASEVTLTALGKRIGRVREYFDGTTGGTETSFSPYQPYTPDQLADARINAAFDPISNWNTLFDEVEIARTSTLGDEEVYVVKKTPSTGRSITDYVSTKTFLVLRRDRQSSIPGGGVITVTETYSDYRKVDGVAVPFETTLDNPGTGKMITRVREVEFDVEIPEGVFGARSP